MLAAQAIETDITQSDAISLAMNYAKDDMGKDAMSFSPNIRRYNATDIRDTKGNLQAYEIGLYDGRGNPHGYINVPIDTDYGVVSSFFYQGVAKSIGLQRGFDAYWNKINRKSRLKITQQRIVGAADGAAAIMFQTSKPIRQLSKLKNIHQYGDEYVFSYIPFGQLREGYLDVTEPDYGRYSVRQYDPNEQRIQNEIQQLREQYIMGIKPKSTQVESHTITGMAPSTNNIIRSTGSGGIGDDSDTSEVHPGHVNFSYYNQEERDWHHGGFCYAGCAPVAFAILYEYWDRHGYPTMVGSASNNNYRNHQDPIVRNMIDNLRGRMRTTCTNNGNGSTRIQHQPNAIGYAYSRGFRNWRGYRSDYSKGDNGAWKQLIKDLNRNRPVVASINVNKKGGGRAANHAVVAYHYKNKPGYAGDRFCFVLGWGARNNMGGPADCKSRDYHYDTVSIGPRD